MAFKKDTTEDLKSIVTELNIPIQQVRVIKICSKKTSVYKLMVAHQFKKFSAFCEKRTYCTLSDTDPYPRPDESTPHPHAASRDRVKLA
jgi:hypothetical protein